MQAPFRKLSLVIALGVLCAAAPVAHATGYLYLEGIKGEPPVPGGPEVWHWIVKPLDPSVNGGVSVAVGDITGDGMDPATVALLLPAVQKVREAAAQWPGPIPQDLTVPLPDAQIGLLLPAVQKVREAAAALPDPTSASFMDLTLDVDPQSLMLLLPAVQKVREAAQRSQSLPGMPPVSDQELFPLLLPAAANAADVAGRIELANLQLPSLLGLPGSDDPRMRFTTGWSLQDGQVTLRMEGAIPAVPEPATWAFWLSGLGVVLLLRRRRNASAHAAAA